MKAKYSDPTYTNDDIRPMLIAKNRMLVAVHPNNEDFECFTTYGMNYGIFVFNPECQKQSSLLCQIAVIHPVSWREDEGEDYEEKGR